MKINSYLMSVVLLGAVFATPVSVKASSLSSSSVPEFRNATEAVLFMGGVNDGMAEAQSLLVVSTVDSLNPLLNLLSYPFRTMAGLARMNANLFLPFSREASIYFLGRASAFEALADLVGEP